jgi:hypothetical protein
MNIKTKKTLWIVACILFPGFLLLWLIYKLWREIIVAIFCSGLWGCAENSAAFDRSPYAYGGNVVQNVLEPTAGRFREAAADANAKAHFRGFRCTQAKSTV